MDIAETSTNARGPEIRAIVLDYGEVLCLRPTEKQLRRMADVFGIDIPQFETLYEKNRRDYDRGDLTPDRYWFAFADEPGFRLAADKIPSLRAWDVEMWSKTNPVMIAWLEALHESGLRTALLSNMHADMVAKVRGEFEWMRNFDCAVFSHEVRLAKPEPKIYQHCLKGLATRAQSARTGCHSLHIRAPTSSGTRKAGIPCPSLGSRSSVRSGTTVVDIHAKGYVQPQGGLPKLLATLGDATEPQTSVQRTTAP
jgi:putative hydrolase of the HAD superfamily